MIIELNDDDTRLLRMVLLQQAQEHLSYADTSEVAERCYKLATKFERVVTFSQGEDLEVAIAELQVSHSHTL